MKFIKAIFAAISIILLVDTTVEAQEWTERVCPMYEEVWCQ